MIAQCGKECRLAEQFALNVKEDGPQRCIPAVSHQVPCMHHKIRFGVLQDRVDYGAVHIVSRTRVAKNHELKLRLPRRWGLERPLSAFARKRFVVVSLSRLQTGKRNL